MTDAAGDVELDGDGNRRQLGLVDHAPELLLGFEHSGGRSTALRSALNKTPYERSRRWSPDSKTGVDR